MQKKWLDLDDTDRVQVMGFMAKRGTQIDVSNNADKTSLLQMRNDVRRAVNAVSDETNKALDANPNDRVTYDNNIQLISNLGALIERIDQQLHLMDMADEGSRKGALVDSWRNSQGKEVKVLNKNQRMVDTDRHARPTTYGFGELVRGMVLGASTPDVRNALSEGTDSAGGYTVPRYLMNQLIDAMRAKTVTVQAGAMTIPIDGAQNTIARVASDPVAGWRVENAAVAESDPTFEGVILAPKSLAVLVKVSRELMEDSLNLDQALMQAFAGSMAVELDRVALFGSGVAPEPRGIFNTTGINVVSMGTNGAALTNYSPLLDALYELELDNAAAPTAQVMHPRTRRTINGFADTTGQPLMPPPALANVPQMGTTTVPINQTQGTAVNASSIIAGDFSQLLIGVRQELRVEILRERFAENLQYAFLAHLRVDVALAHPASFCAIKGIIP